MPRRSNRKPLTLLIVVNIFCICGSKAEARCFASFALNNPIFTPPVDIRARMELLGSSKYLMISLSAACGTCKFVFELQRKLNTYSVCMHIHADGRLSLA